MRIDIREKRFGTRVVLKDISLEIADGSFTIITGPSGSGKTTLLRIIAGLDQDFSGRVSISGKLGMVFQEPRLLPWMTVAGNIEIVGGQNKIREVLAAVGLSGEEATYPSALSLGMARRAALARALSIEPGVLLLDEPFVSLDDRTAEEMRALVRKLWRQQRFTCILVTHAVGVDRDLAERFIRLEGSPARVVQDLHLTAA